MNIYREIKENLLESSCLALGVFDGVHLGHRKVILNAVNKAQKRENVSAVVTFSKHPRSIISKSLQSIIMPLQERLEIFESLGVEAAIVLDFDKKLASMSAKEYLKKILIKSLNAKSITIGYNHKFGADKQGDSSFLEEHSKTFGYEVNVISPVKIDNHIVSSSIIRKFILKGDITAATKFLGRPFTVRGTVIHGQQIGRTIGFPTANLSFPDEYIIPASGVYSGLVKINTKVYHAVINVGKKPTIGDLEKDLVEAHILDFDEDIYGSFIEVSFLERLRNEKKFDSLEELKTQIQKDCAFVHSTVADF